MRPLAVEDTAALAGFAPAATGVLVRQLGGPARSDAIASLVIGLRLGVTATGLAWPLADLLIGRSLPPDRLRQARDIRAVPGVDEVLDVSRSTWRRRRPCSQRRRIRRPPSSPVGWTSTT